MKIFSAEQIRQWDAATIEREPITSADLMERAATACFQWISLKYTKETTFIILCGNGNNGGDGLALARMLGKAGYDVQAYILDGENSSTDFRLNLDRYPTDLPAPKVIDPGNLPLIDHEKVIVDALFGTGLNRPLEGLAATLVAHINAQAGTIISIDIPSGLFADRSSTGNNVIKSTQTLSFETYKPGLLVSENAAAIGDVYLLNIGLDSTYYTETPSKFSAIDNAGIKSIYKPREKFTHKYNFGHAHLFAGSRAMMGAAILCAKSCMRAGAGLVTVQTEPGTEAVIQTAFPEAITNSDTDWRKAVLKKHVVGIGPGLQQSAENERLLLELVQEYQGALVVDASALQLLAKHINPLSHRGAHATVLTPHTGEFEKLFGKTATDFDRIDLALHKARELNVFIVLKGHHSFIACPDGTGFFNTTGNAGLATAGSGDVLTGILCGLLAQGYPAKDACVLGVYIHGLAGDLAATRRSQESLIATDIIDELGTAFLQIADQPDSNITK